MILDTLIARSQDGLLLCEVPDTVEAQLQFEVKRNFKSALRRGAFAQQIEYQQVDAENVKCLYKTHQGITFVVFYNPALNLKLACCFLDELRLGFNEVCQLANKELLTKYGSQSGIDYRSKIETLTNSDSYKFQSFERFIKKKKQEFVDAGSQKNIDRLKRDIVELQSIMQENLKLLMDREGSLTTMSQKARSLKDDSKIFKDKSTNLANALWWKKNIRHQRLCYVHHIKIAISFPLGEHAIDVKGRGKFANDSWSLFDSCNFKNDFHCQLNNLGLH